MDVSINFPTRTIEALIQQNKTLSAKLNSLSKLCDTQGLEIRELKNQNESFNRESQKKSGGEPNTFRLLSKTANIISKITIFLSKPAHLL